ncbi:unnamed protein product [Heterobilharzia americana]|nr:unnamed protein product [Heterobilharzia americana]
MRGKARSKRRASTECPDLVPEERIFANPSALSPHLLCPICQEVFTHPQRAPCGHSFCKRCIELWIENASICPIDRKPITSGSMHHDFILENIIGDYMVACPFRALGCGFIGRLCLLPSHKKSCSLNPNEMPPVLRNHAISSLKEGNSNLQNPELLYKRRVADRTYSSMARTETDTETSSEIAGSSSQEIGIQEDDASRRLNEENGEQTPGHTDDNEVELLLLQYLVSYIECI